MEDALAALCESAHGGDGIGAAVTHLPLVSALRYTAHQPLCLHRSPPGLIFILRGRKIAHVEAGRVPIGPSQFVISLASQMVRIETDCSGELPVLGLHVGLDRAELTRLAALVHGGSVATAPIGALRCATPASVTPEVGKALDELISVLGDRTRAAALGAAALTRLYFAVMRCSEGRLLAEGLTGSSVAGLIAKVIGYMEDHLARRMSIDELASLAGMSNATFHRRFREAIGDSPLRFLKKLRLSRAKDLLALRGHGVAQAAYAVGYQSSNQFSRDFRRHFGVSPRDAASLPINAFGDSPVAD